MKMQQLIQHPIYPGHFLKGSQYKNGFTCNGCGEDGHGTGFRCDVCNLDLHTSCVTVNVAEEKVIQHPSHPGHCLSYVRYSHAYRCDECREYVVGNGYRCGACDFDLHISCATISTAEGKAIQHPRHPGHWLSYVRYPRGYACDGCGEEIAGWRGYNCADCNFDLHECCAAAPPALDQSFHGGNGNWVHFQMRPPGGSQMRCSGCEKGMSGMGYYCTRSSCDYALHPTCALRLRCPVRVDRAPPQPGERQVICHPWHPEHGLSYIRSYPDGFYCSGCGEDIEEKGKGYRCGACDFDLHECCTTPSPVLHESFHCGKGDRVQFQWRPPSRSQTRCSECAGRMLGFGYYCTHSSCGYALHATCASGVAAPTRRIIQPEAAPPEPDKGDNSHRGRKIVVRGGKFLLHLAVGALTGDPTTIGGAFTDLVLSD